MPLDQWLYFDALECLALAGAAQLTETDCAPVRPHVQPLLAAWGAVAAVLTQLLLLAERLSL